MRKTLVDRTEKRIKRAETELAEAIKSRQALLDAGIDSASARIKIQKTLKQIEDLQGIKLYYAP